MKPTSDLEEHGIKGKVAGSSKNFKITDSDYLNISLVSNKEIDLTLDSIPEIITLHIKETNQKKWITSTKITISGLKPNTTYHKYEDHYYNHTTFTTDKNGEYVFKQDISKSHTIFIQPKASTYFLKETGWEDSTGTPLSPSIATWDSRTRLATLETDIFGESIEIEVDNATFDGQEHTSTGSGTGSGIYLATGRNNLIIKNLKIREFSNGIYLDTDNTNNVIENNTIQSNAGYGILLFHQNTSNNIANNTISENSYGIHLDSNNSVNTIIQNCILDNSIGVYIQPFNNDNSIVNNNFINSAAGTNAFNHTVDNIFNSNYWDDWSGFDPYTINPEGQDNTPLSVPWDATPPITTVSLSGTLGDNNWYTSDVDVTLTAEDLYPCSLGIKNTLYSFDGTFWTNYRSPFTINNEGFTTIYYYSVDSSDNVEDTKTEEIKIDKTPPEIIINTPEANGEYVLEETLLANWSVSDNLSGVSSSSGTVPNGDPVDTSSLGEKYFTVTATDNAGNSSSETRIYYVKDTTPPITTIKHSGTLGNNGWYTSDVQVTLFAEDNSGSGIYQTLYSFNRTAWNVYTSPFPITDEGTTTVYYYSIDNSGNIENTKTSEVKVDKTPPEIIITTPSDESECILNETILADWSVSDSYSGVEYSSGTAPSGDLIDTNSLGEKYFTVIATDNAGNSSSQTTIYYVKTDTNALKRGFMLDSFFSQDD